MYSGIGKERSTRVRINFKRLSIMAISIASILAFTACTSQQGDMNKGKNISTAKVTKTDTPLASERPKDKKIDIEKRIKEIDIEKLKRGIINQVNDDVWYNGNFAFLKGLEGQKTSIRIYASSKSLYDVYIVLDTPFDPYFRGKKTKKKCYYYASARRPESGEYLLPISVAIMDSEDELKQDLLGCGGDIFLTSSTIEFPIAKKPTFPEMNSERKKIIKNIEALIPNLIQEVYGKKKGSYKVYIRNFRNEEGSTYVVIESKEGKDWMIKVGILGDGSVVEGNTYLDLTDKSYTYKATQCKKVSFEREVNLSK